MFDGLLMKLKDGPWRAYDKSLLHRLRETERRAWHAEADLGLERIAKRNLEREVEQLRATLRNRDFMEEG